MYISTLLFVVISTLPTFEGLTVNAELLMMMPVTAAVLIMWNVAERSREGQRSAWDKYLVAGLLGGLGGCLRYRLWLIW